MCGANLEALVPAQLPLICNTYTSYMKLHADMELHIHVVKPYVNELTSSSSFTAGVNDACGAVRVNGFDVAAATTVAEGATERFGAAGLTGAAGNKGGAQKSEECFLSKQGDIM
jgi:hypothetical protein